MYESCLKNENCDSLFKMFNDASANIDIICIQEDLENNQKSIKGLSNYILASSCIAEPLNETYLVNRIFVNKSISHLIEEVKNLNITTNCRVPRCAVYMKINNVSLVNIHLCGGRFDDPYYNDLQDTRHNQIKSIFDQLGFVPDLIVGDFNTEATMEDAEILLQKNIYILMS